MTTLVAKIRAYAAGMGEDAGLQYGALLMNEAADALDRYEQALREISLLRMTGPCPIGPLFGAGASAAFSTSGRIAAVALGREDVNDAIDAPAVKCARCKKPIPGANSAVVNYCSIECAD